MAGHGNPTTTIWPGPTIRWLLILAVALVHIGTFSAALYQHSALTDDSIQYLRLADNLAEHGSYSQSYLAPLLPDVQRTPGYPVFLLLLGRSIPLVLAVQHLLVLAAAWLLARGLRPLTGSKAANFAGWALALMPYPAIFASMVLSEPLFIFLSVAAFAGIARGWEQGSARTLALGMCAAGLACLVRPVAWPWMLLIPLMHLVFAIRQQQLRRLPVIAALLLPFLIPAAWMARNASLDAGFSLSSMGGMGMLHGRLGGLEAMRRGLSFDEHTLYMCADSMAALEVGLPGIRTYPEMEQTHESERLWKGAGGLAVKGFVDSPWQAGKFQVGRVGAMLGGVGWGWARSLTGSKVTAAVLAGLQGLLNLLMFAGVLLALVRLRKWKAWEWLALLIIGVTLLVSAAAWADGRYRAVVDPLMLALLAGALARAWPQWR